MAKRRAAIWVSLLRNISRSALLVASAGAWSGEPANNREYEVKAAFLYNFTRFVEWPDSSFVAGDSPLLIGTYCDDPFSTMLERIVKGRTVHGRSIVVRKLETPAAARDVHLVFVCALNDAWFGRVEDAVRSSPVLTVGETDAARDLGGIIKFDRVGDKVRFEVSAAAAEQAGLRISAQLQKLAIVVRRSQ